MWPLEWDGGWVRQTRSFDWKIMRREHEMFLSPCGALCRGMPHGYVAYRLCEVSAHEISSDRPDLSLFGFSVFRPPRPGFRLSAFRHFGLSAFRPFGFPTFRGWGGKCSLSRWDFPCLWYLQVWLGIGFGLAAPIFPALPSRPIVEVGRFFFKMINPLSS